MSWSSKHGKKDLMLAAMRGEIAIKRGAVGKKGEHYLSCPKFTCFSFWLWAILWPSSTIGLDDKRLCGLDDTIEVGEGA